MKTRPAGAFGVLVAAVLLSLFGGVWIYVAWLIRANAAGRDMELAGIAAGVGVWMIVTAAGLARLRGWARISAIAMGIGAVAVMVICEIAGVRIFGVDILLGLVGAGWWFYFARSGMRGLFLSSASEEAAG